MNKIPHIPAHIIPQPLSIWDPDMANTERSMILSGFEYRNQVPHLARQFVTQVQYTSLRPLRK